MTTLTLGHGNGHNKMSLVEFVREAGADSFGCNEAQELRGPLNQIPGHRVIGPSKEYAEERNRARSTCLVVRDRREHLGQLDLKVSERVAGHEKFAPDRVLVAAFYDHPIAQQLGAAGVAHFALHPDATVMKRQLNHPIVQEYREALGSAYEHMRAARRDGYLIALTGDLQVHARFRASYGPREQVAGPLKMRCRVVGIDWIMIDRRLQYVGPTRVRRLFDHRGFVAKVRAA